MDDKKKRVEALVETLKAELESFAFVGDLGEGKIVIAAEGDSWTGANHVIKLIKDICDHGPHPKLELLRYLALFKALILEQVEEAPGPESEGEVIYEDKEG